MTRLLLLVEGQSEELFVKKTLAPYLEAKSIYVRATIVATKRLMGGGNYRGGVVSWGQIRRDVGLLLQGNAWVSTLIDYYGLPDDFPRPVDQAKEVQQQVHQYETEFAKAIDHSRFIPFLALHELESWIFSAPNVVADYFGRQDVVNGLIQIVKLCGGPEGINHGKESHPKARLVKLFPRYKETADGATLLDKIGIDTIRSSCPHFHSWILKLEALAGL